MITAVVLAAGGSARLGGRPKQLLKVDGVPLVVRVLTAVCGSRVHGTVVVTGCRAEEVRAAGGDFPVRWVANPAWPQGMATSLAAGLAAVGGGAAGVLVVLADQPFLTSSLVDRLIDAFGAARAPAILRPACGSRCGHPVLVGRPFLATLGQARGDEGGRTVLAAFRRYVVTIPATEREIMDVDTWEDALKCGASWD